MTAVFCTWTEDLSGEFWDTTCGQMFQFIDGGPDGNRMKYCCYCGGRLETQAALPDLDDDEE